MEQFESIKKVLGDETVLRSAQRLAHELGIAYRDFVIYLEVAMWSCHKNGYDAKLHFKQIPGDYELSQYGCYLTIEKLSLVDKDQHNRLKKYFYTKDFAGRYMEKQKVHEGLYEPKGQQRWIKEREIRNAKWGINIGSETDGKGKYLRPVLILKTIGTLSLALPLTSKGKEGTHPFAHLYYKLKSITFDYCESFVLLNQLKMIDKRRCIKKLGIVEQWELGDIKNLLRNIYF